MTVIQQTFAFEEPAQWVRDHGFKDFLSHSSKEDGTIVVAIWRLYMFWDRINICVLPWRGESTSIERRSKRHKTWDNSASNISGTMSRIPSGPRDWETFRFDRT